MNHVRTILLASAASLVMASGASAADHILSGGISSSGQKVEGVTVSAKREGSTITTSVYSDQDGNYYFPPMADGKYAVWTNALGFETAKGTVDLSANAKHNVSLKPIADREAMIPTAE
jgi:virginiamycin B lyase